MFDELLSANEQYAEGFSFRDLAGRPRRGLAIVTCMDTRIEPMSILGLAPGDANILRNAGGRVTDDVLRSLLLATVLLEVSQVVVMHHTRCALAGHTETELRSAVAAANPEVALTQALLAMPDPDDSLATDVGTILKSPGLPRTLLVAGWRYDVDTGRVVRIIEQSRDADAPPSSR